MTLQNKHINFYQLYGAQYDSYLDEKGEVCILERIHYIYYHWIFFSFFQFVFLFTKTIRYRSFQITSNAFTMSKHVCKQ